MWGFASDDCHDVHDERTFDRGWILVNSAIDPKDCRQGLVGPDALRRDMLENIRSGNFWAVVRRRGRRERFRTRDDGSWPVISHDQGQIHVAADRPCETIEFCAGSSSRRESTSASGSAGFAYDVGDWEDYVRVRVVQKSDEGQCLDGLLSASVHPAGTERDLNAARMIWDRAEVLGSSCRLFVRIGDFQLDGGLEYPLAAGEDHRLVRADVEVNDDHRRLVGLDLEVADELQLS